MACPRKVFIINKEKEYLGTAKANNNCKETNSYHDSKKRNDFVKETTAKLADLIDLGKYYPEYFNIADNLKLKIGGYNCSLGSRVLQIQKRSLKALLWRFPFLGSHLLMKGHRSKDAYEVPFSYDGKKETFNNTRYSSVYFASLNNYLNPFFRQIESDRTKDNSNLLILPMHSQNWSNYKKTRVISNLDIVFVEDLIDSNFAEEIRDVSRQLLNSCNKYKSQIIDLYNFCGVSFGNAFYPILKKFVEDFVSTQIVFTKYFEVFLKNVSLPQTQFYIARNRRSMENSFVQIANMINGNTNMLLHGMIFPNLDTHLFAYNFSPLKRVYAWGQQGKDVIEFRQKRLNEKCPDILINKTFFFESLKQRTNIDSSKKVTFVMQVPTYNYISNILKSLPKGMDATIRIGLDDKNLLKSFRKLITNANVHLDDLKEPVESHFVDSAVFVSYTSTTILEAIYNKIPTILLGFPELMKNYPCVFWDTSLSGSERSLIFASDIGDLVSKIERILTDADFRNEILELNQKLVSYFISPAIR